MAALDLGEIADFPFVDPPDSRNVADGVRLLEELGAVSPGRRRDPADRHGAETGPAPGGPAARPDDPGGQPQRVRPRGADHHGRAVHPGSQGTAQPTPARRPTPCTRASPSRVPISSPSSACGTTCATSSVSCPAPRSAACAAASTCTTCGCASGRTCTGNSARRPGRLGIAAGPDHGTEHEGRFPAELVRPGAHVAAGGPAVAHRDEGRLTEPRGKRRGPAEFAGARGARFAIFPDSVLARKPPQWVVAAELVETSRLWARTAARIEPEWAEPLAAHLVRRSYSEPHWDAQRGAAMALREGDPVRAADRGGAAGQLRQGRPGGGPRDVHPAAPSSRATGGPTTGSSSVNQRLLEEAEDLERRARRRGIVADDAALFDFYDRRIPKDVTSARHFDAWWKKERAADPDLLTLLASRSRRPGRRRDRRRPTIPAAGASFRCRMSSPRVSRMTG